MKNLFQHIGLTIIVGLISGVVGASLVINKTIPSQFMSGTQKNNTTTTATTSVTNSQEQQVINTVQKTSPAVVSITISQNVPAFQSFRGSPFDQFFRMDPFSIPPQQDTQKQEIGGGSGFIVSPDGVIVTNKHVVSQTNAEYTVITNDNKKYKATVLARDPANDIAIIKIDAHDLPSLQFADSSKIQVGQTVIAIGNALGEFNNTVSTGVISGLSRSIIAGDILGQSEHLNQVIQTDTAINPGNSGGPLLDLAGQVVGVNSAMAQGGQNVAFAIPANIVKPVVDSVKKTGKISRPFLGVRYVQITPTLKDSNKLPVDYGVLVIHGQGVSDMAVVSSSPADKAGIQDGDIILEAEGIKLDEKASLSNIIQQKQVGDTVTLKIMHEEQQKTVQVKLTEMPQ